MDMVDSKIERLPGPVVVAKAAENMGTGDYPAATALAMVAKEMQMDSADIKQLGNTVFLAHRGVGNNRNKMVGRAFNMDIGRNFLTNALDYITYLQEKGITHYTTIFRGGSFLNAFKFFQRMTKNTDTTILIGTQQDGSYVAYIKIGKDPIPEWPA